MTERDATSQTVPRSGSSAAADGLPSPLEPDRSTPHDRRATLLLLVLRRDELGDRRVHDLQCGAGGEGGWGWGEKG